MPHEMSVRIPAERGAQLREFARLQSLGISEAIGSLLDRAVITGLVRELPMPDIEVTAGSDGVCLQVGGVRVHLSVARAESLADSLRKVARTPGATVLDMDDPQYIIELCRQGRGVVLSIAKNGEKNKTAYGKHGLFSRTFACDVARALGEMIAAAAKGAAVAAERAQQVTVGDGAASGVDHETVEQLLGDLEIGGDEGTTETVLDESDVSALEAAMKDA